MISKINKHKLSQNIVLVHNFWIFDNTVDGHQLIRWDRCKVRHPTTENQMFAILFSRIFVFVVNINESLDVFNFNRIIVNCINRALLITVFWMLWFRILYKINKIIYTPYYHVVLRRAVTTRHRVSKPCVSPTFCISS